MCDSIPTIADRPSAFAVTLAMRAKRPSLAPPCSSPSICDFGGTSPPVAILRKLGLHAPKRTWALSPMFATCLVCPICHPVPICRPFCRHICQSSHDMFGLPSRCDFTLLLCRLPRILSVAFKCYCCAVQDRAGYLRLFSVIPPRFANLGARIIDSQRETNTQRRQC